MIQNISQKLNTPEFLKLSIVIVNYNVKYFLEQALLSVFKAGAGIAMEVFVVDNNSQDGSAEMLKSRFPQVRLIENKDNPGFAKANNQAIKQASGEYILLLNPDTVLEEDTLSVCIDFMDKHPDAGALGVKMIDGSGVYLQESKRGLPTPMVSFFKITGLNAVFPKSKLFNYYYMGHLHEEETNVVEVLAGAFMFMRKETLDKIGLLDEMFFMYGEDVDLSYRVSLGGYKNYYTPDTKIIHYKGESTRKGSLNYIKTFYEAMILFAEKHFNRGRNRWFVFMIKLGIYLKAIQSAVSESVKKFLLPLIEFVFIWLAFSGIAVIWENLYYKNPEYFGDQIYLLMLPAYSLIYILCLTLLGSYDVVFRKSRQVGAVILGFCLIAIAYSFLPENLRSSRFLVFATMIISFVVISLIRSLFHYISYGKFSVKGKGSKRTVIIGSAEEYERITRLIDRIGVQMKILGRVSPNEVLRGDAIANIDDLIDVARAKKADQVIFCGKDMSSEQIMYWMTQLSNKVEFKIAPHNMDSIIGSKSRDSSGELYTIEVSYNIDDPMNRRLKRLFDVAVATGFLISMPLSIWFYERRVQLIRNIVAVLRKKITWVGYIKTGKDNLLPAMLPSVLHIGEGYQIVEALSQAEKLNFNYARDYSILTDFYIVLNRFSNLDRKWN